ncbi:uncharacterized protein G2W53_016174 [Senna tora]|uniref:Uncharacterized protein n=1 Tax=Senna tora TaxID=362788 RepID=A0A834WWL1_9FABA|nr:uncharacterized protein G2W53_016174 [Senna tora]
MNWQTVPLVLFGLRFQVIISTMLQWMGGSRRKVTTSRKSTLKRQKQYFEQRRRQQQNLQMMGSESCSDVPGISGQCPKEYRSLDILSLLDLSASAKKCDCACLEGGEDVEVKVSTVPGHIFTNQLTDFTNMDTPVEFCRIEETKAPLGCQIEASSKKVLVSSPDYQDGALNGIPSKPSDWQTVNDQHLGLSVIDLLSDDGPHINVEERPTFEDHVAFSLEGLGKVGTETPVHSPKQPIRVAYAYSPSLKDGKKMKFSKDVNHVLEDLELEVDTMMQDIKVASISSFPNFPFNKGKQSLETARDYKHFSDHAHKYGSSNSQEFFFNAENNNDDIWNVPCSSFFNEKFDDERQYNTSWKKKTFRMGTGSPDFLKGGICKMANYEFEDDLPKKRSSAAATEGFDMTELPASYSKHQYENDYDLFVAKGASSLRCSRSDGNFNVQSIVPEDVTDNSSLLSEESCTSTAVRSEAITHSPSRLVTRENCKEQKYAFARPGNKCRSKEGNFKSVSNLSKERLSHYSNSILEEELGAHDSWQFKERYASVNINSRDTLFCHNLETNFAVFESNKGTEGPFNLFTAPEFKDEACPSFSGLKSGAHNANSLPCSFTSEKSAFGDSPVFSDVSRPTSPNYSPKFQFKGNIKNVAPSFCCETPSPGLSVQESVSKDEETKVKLQQDSCGNFELREEIFMGNNGWTSEKKMLGDNSTSDNHTQDCKGEKDTNIVMTRSLETTNSFGHVEEISSSLKKPDTHEGEVDKTQNSSDAEILIKCKIANEVMENKQPEERNMVTRKHNKERINLSGQVMYESYVLQFLCVQKVLKEASVGNFKNS